MVRTFKNPQGGSLGGVFVAPGGGNESNRRVRKILYYTTLYNFVHVVPFTFKNVCRSFMVFEIQGIPYFARQYL